MSYCRKWFMLVTLTLCNFLMLDVLKMASVQAEATVVVDTTVSEGLVPFLFRAGMFLNDNPLGGPFKTFFAHLKPGAVEMVPIRDGNFKSLKEYEDRLPSLPTTQWLSEVSRSGGQPVIALMEVPIWLRQSGHGDANYRLPRDWEGWASYVEATVRFYNGTLHLDAEYVLWDEPDLAMFWKGATEDDYFNLYRYTVLGARRADPKAKVGGPATSWWGGTGPGSDGTQPMMKRFIEFCSKTAVTEVGLKKLPIDFVVWHQFDTYVQGDPMQYLAAVEQIREWLKQGGYNPRTPLIIGSWNTWLNFGKDPNELSPERDQEFAAAYAVYALVGMDRAGIAQHMYFNLFENWQWNWLARDGRDKEFAGQDFFGGFGLFNRDGILKPVFNAFKAIGMLEGTRIHTSTEDPYLTVVASRKEGVTYVLVANFYWPGESTLALRIRKLIENGYPIAQLNSWRKALTREMAQEVDEGKRSIASLPIPESAKNDLESVGHVDNFFRMRDAGKSLQIKIKSGATGGGVEVERYSVDKEHGNAFRATTRLANVRSSGTKQALTRVGQQLIQWGLLENEFLKGDVEAQGRDIQAALSRLTSEQRRKIEVLVQESVEDAVDQVNHFPEITLAKQSAGRLLRQGGVVTIDAQLKPYSVHVFVVRDRAN